MAVTYLASALTDEDGNVHFCLFEQLAAGVMSVLCSLTAVPSIAPHVIAGIAGKGGVALPVVTTDSPTLASRLLRLGIYAEVPDMPNSIN